MVDNRNLTSHTYIEVIAEGIFKNLKKYYKLLFKVYAKISKNINL
jgi:hypothetical protein